VSKLNLPVKTEMLPKIAPLGEKVLGRRTAVRAAQRNRHLRKVVL